jgi:hypothetical protein
MPHRTGAAGRAADHALRPRFLIPCDRAAPGEGRRASCSIHLMMLSSICLCCKT